MRYVKLMSVVLIAFSIGGIAVAQPPPPEIEGATIVATGFNGPQGILVDPDGNLWVIDSGLGGDQDTQYISLDTGEQFPTKWGLTTRIVMVSPDGEQTDVATLPSVFVSEMETSGGARLALLDGALYATSGVWIGGLDVEPPSLVGTVVRVVESEVTEVADLWAFEEANNPDGLILESHPYGITPGPDGWLWVADAGANALLRVNPETGEIALVAAFKGLPGAFPNPNRNDAVEADPVPTAVAFDDDGNAYVSLLSGFPFIPGSAKVVRVTPEGEVSDYAVGLTMPTDLRRGPDGELYAVQFGMFTEEGPVPNAGTIVRVKAGDASEVVVDSLPFPTSIAFDEAGNAYVTVNGVGAPGSGAVARFDALTAMEGAPMMMGE